MQRICLIIAMVWFLKLVGKWSRCLHLWNLRLSLLMSLWIEGLCRLLLLHILLLIANLLLKRNYSWSKLHPWLFWHLLGPVVSKNTASIRRLIELERLGSNWCLLVTVNCKRLLLGQNILGSTILIRRHWHLQESNIWVWSEMCSVQIARRLSVFVMLNLLILKLKTWRSWDMCKGHSESLGKLVQRTSMLLWWGWITLITMSLLWVMESKIDLLWLTHIYLYLLVPNICRAILLLSIKIVWKVCRDW